mgnify:CR=1 FL=1
MKEVKKLEKLLTKGKITRRQFISGMSALGLAAAVSPVFLGKPAQAASLGDALLVLGDLDRIRDDRLGRRYQNRGGSQRTL